MENKTGKWAGTALVLGSGLMVVTMVLHPAGGSLPYLVRASQAIITAHALGMVAIPVNLFGFRGLAKHFSKERELSGFAFAFMLVGLLAGLCAAAVNGLALPLFIKSYGALRPEGTEAVSLFLRYNSAVNHAFDFIFIAAICVAIVLWSAAIVKGRELPRWIGHYGLLLGCLGIVVLFSGFTLVDLHGFRLFILGLVTWIVAVGLLLRNHRTASAQ